jgi:hypothetical protein
MGGPRKRSGPATTGPPRTVPAPTSTTASITDLVDSAWSFAEQCRRLITSKAYRDTGGDS